MSRKTVFAFLAIALAACNPAYLPVPVTGILTCDEIEMGAYASLGFLGREVRPLAFRGVVANFGVYFRKGIADEIDWTMTADTYGVTTAFGFAQNDAADTVLRPRAGVGWMNAMAGLDWATRLSEGTMTDYAVGGTFVAWIGDAFWTEDPGLTYGFRFGALGQMAAEPRWRAPVSGGLRLDWAPLQFGARASPETLLDLIGGSRNPFGRPYGSRYFDVGDWPRPRLAFEPAAWTITGGPAITYHRDRGNWTHGGEVEGSK